MDKKQQDASTTKAVGYLLSVVCGAFFLSLAYSALTFGMPNNFAKVSVFLLGFGALAGVSANFSPHVGRASVRAFFLVLNLICFGWCVQSLWSGTAGAPQGLVLLAVTLMTYVMRRSFVVPHSNGTDEKSL